MKVKSRNSENKTLSHQSQINSVLRKANIGSLNSSYLNIESNADENRCENTAYGNLLFEGKPIGNRALNRFTNIFSFYLHTLKVNEFYFIQSDNKRRL